MAIHQLENNKHSDRNSSKNEFNHVVGANVKIRDVVQDDMPKWRKLDLQRYDRSDTGFHDLRRVDQQGNFEEPSFSEHFEWFMSRYKIFEDGAAVFKVIEEKEKFIGYVWITPLHWPRDQMSRIGVLTSHVDKESRNHGYGTKGIIRALEEARDRNLFDQVQLSVVEGNPAMRLYKRLGFVQKEVHEDEVVQSGKKRAMIYMELEVPLKDWRKEHYNLKSRKRD